MFEVSFKITYPNFYCELSRKYPSSKLFLWSDKENDVIEVTVDDPEDFNPIVDEIKQRHPNEVLEESNEKHKAILIVRNCCCSSENSFINQIGSLTILNLYPAILENGWWHHRSIFLRHEDFDALLERFKKTGIEYEILSKGSFNGYISSHLSLTTDTLFSNLTQKQVEALVAAYKYGYFKTPREKGLESIAETMNVPRTTLQSHLKKAENKIMDSLAPYLHLFKYTSKP